MRIVFMGTPDFAATVLESLIAARHDVVCAYSQPPRPSGRGHKQQPSPVQKLAEEHGIPVRCPTSLKSPEEQAAFAELKADVAVVAAYGLILPKAILDAPTKGCLNVHGSLLPRWRGAAPIQRAIMAGDDQTGICIMRMDEGLDTGPVLLRDSIPIGPETTAGELHDQLADLGARLMLVTLGMMTLGDTLIPMSQPESGVTYAKKIEREESRIDWNKPAIEIDRLIRAMSPHPGAWFEHSGERFKLLKAHPLDRRGKPGQVLEGGLTIACIDGAMGVQTIQRQGKAPMDADAFLRGYVFPPGTVLT
ncbi:10-formyltetrahydrofolate:L-methionyl-tRNA(fMet) N-formyltransferase [Rhodospirillaceae bacterium LM-1]|nr:10-formyltetrahydrofolate:L-methionyl-tRNA(fMet) N-formyltransferase [Rhodospirillaceae bacterium LM-1]